MEYKKKNELVFCTFQHQESSSNEKKVLWTTTKKYLTNFSTVPDVEKMLGELKLLMSENNICGTISKITCSENCHIVEFTLYPSYIVEKEAH